MHLNYDKFWKFQPQPGLSMTKSHPPGRFEELAGHAETGAPIVKPATRSNVLFITVDQWAASLLGSADHPVIETPTLDQLARIGTRYTNAYAECPICIPARRSMMTGASPRGHGDREFQPALPMPQGLPSLAQCFRDGGYQTYAVGKLHVYPQRDRVGFDDALIAEEGRGHLGGVDDYELFLADKGYPGQQFMHGMSNNEYGWRTWHLPEELHVTNWVTFAAARAIRRRDPTRPGLWHVSYTHPHPPLVPLASYFERYRARAIDAPVMADWARDAADLPYAVQIARNYWEDLGPERLADTRRAVDDRLVGLQDVMPTLLDLAGLPVPKTCEGLSMAGGQRREFLYGESLEGPKATRMIHDGRHKLIWYPAGNRFQLFDLDNDPRELKDIAASPAAAPVRKRLEAELLKHLYGADLAWIENGKLIGMPAPELQMKPNRELSGQRGLHYPPQPIADPKKVVGAG
jgi:arylsulfatase A-like enzyme